MTSHNQNGCAFEPKKLRSDLAHGTCATKYTKIPVTSLIFGNFYLDYCDYRFGLGLALGLGLELRLEFRIRFLSFIKVSTCTECAPTAPSLFQKTFIAQKQNKIWNKMLNRLYNTEWVPMNGFHLFYHHAVQLYYLFLLYCIVFCYPTVFIRV